MLFVKFFLPICLLFVVHVLGISQQSNDTQVFEKTIRSIVLLKNEVQLLPLQRLDTLQIAYIGLDIDQNRPLEKTLKKYSWVTTLELPASGSAADASAWAAAQAANYNLFILGINDLSELPTPNYLFDHFYLTALMEKAKTIAVVLGGNRALLYLPNLAQAQGLIVAPLQNDFSEALAAQLIFGGIGANGRLEKDLSGAFKIGAGLDSEGGLRLRYSPPALVGFDEEKLRTGIQAIVQEGLEAQAYPGAQVLVAKDGHVVYHETFGHHTYDAQQAVQEDDLYDFASITKISASLPAVMRLYGEGKFNIDESLGQIYPGFKNSNKSELSFRRMLTHTSRLMAWIPFWRGTLKGNAKYPWQKNWNGLMNNTGKYKGRTFAPDSSALYSVKVTDGLFLHRRYKKQILKSIEKSPLNEKPGYVYSDLHFYLYPEIVPALTGQDFESYLKTNFYQPLGAYTLTFNPLRFFSKNQIVPTERDTFFRRTLLHGYVHDEGAAMLGGVSGHAGLFGTAGDLAKLMQLYLNGGSYGGEQFIKKEVLDEFIRCQYCQEGVHRGIGFDKPFLEYDPKRSSVAKDASLQSFGHSGYTGTFTWVDPAHKLIYIFFSNRVYPTRDNRKLLDMSIRPRVQQAIYDALIR